MDLQEVLTQLPSQINVVLVIGLLAVGYIVKHVPALEKVNNNLIPVILPVIAVVVTLITGDLSTSAGITQAIMSGFVNAAFAVWAHNTGKNIFEMLPSGGNK